MFSYRHSFHAGNFADVLKHTVQIAVMDYLQQKDKGFCYHDSHSGAGMYRIDSREMQKNGEYLAGVGRLLSRAQTDPLLKRYIEVVKACNKGDRLTQYPGSPAIAGRLKRPQDRMQLTEMHSTDRRLLGDYFARDKRVRVYEQDAWKGMKALLPPPEKRGMVLIDPSYEDKDDYATLSHSLKDAHRRFASGVYLIWYPVLNRAQTEMFIKRLIMTKIPNMIRIEHCVKPDNSGGMTGSGMVVVNPPYTLESAMRDTLPDLNDQLSDAWEGKWMVERLTAE